jgi:very-short-patch-repair endonuclease
MKLKKVNPALTKLISALAKRSKARKSKVEFARQMRKNPTRAEQALWMFLRSKNMLGLRWRRQAIIAGYIVDFYCPAKKLVIEVDGKHHKSPEVKQYDKKRSKHLRSLGLKIKRYSNSYILRDPERTAQKIARICRVRIFKEVVTKIV